MHEVGKELRELLELGMRERRQVALVYNKLGDVPGRRIVNPHVLYVTSKDNVCLHAVQVSGPTDSGGLLPAWRPFDLSIARDFELLPSSFEVDPGLNLGNTKMYTRILYSV